MESVIEHSEGSKITNGKVQNGASVSSPIESSESEANARWPLVYEAPLADAAISPSHLTGSQDLVARLDLLGSYDKAVRPYLNPKADPSFKDQDGPIDLTGGKGATDKAKSIKKHYSHMIIDVPGQNKLAKDHHIRDLLLNPDGPDSTKIIPFDSNALRDAFTLDIGVLPDFDTSIWRADAAEERKKKKKRKQDDAMQVTAPPSPAPVGMNTASVNAGGNIKKRKVEG